tara:strand:- start:15057 stop:15554 length:498 start_codon:yes stop_codon:yes gene_type:complete
MIINKIADGLYGIENFVPQVVMDYVNSLFAEPDDWMKVKLQEDLPRLSKDGHHPLILKPFQKVVDQLGYDYLCDGYSIWKDSEGFCMPMHKDNLSFSGACQIYLPSTDDVKGTSFLLEDQTTYTFDFVPNTGYFVDNAQQIVHGCPNPVGKGKFRHSLYVRYTAK